MPRKSSTFFGVEVAIGTHEAPGYLACFHDGKDGVVIDLFSRSLRLDVLRNRVGKFEGFFVLRRMQRSSTRRSIKQGLPTVQKLLIQKSDGAPEAPAPQMFGNLEIEQQRLYHSFVGQSSQQTAPAFLFPSRATARVIASLAHMNAVADIISQADQPAHTSAFRLR